MLSYIQLNQSDIDREIGWKTDGKVGGEIDWAGGPVGLQKGRRVTCCVVIVLDHPSIFTDFESL